MIFSNNPSVVCLNTVSVDGVHRIGNLFFFRSHKKYSWLYYVSSYFIYTQLSDAILYEQTKCTFSIECWVLTSLQSYLLNGNICTRDLPTLFCVIYLSDKFLKCILCGIMVWWLGSIYINVLWCRNYGCCYTTVCRLRSMEKFSR